MTQNTNPPAYVKMSQALYALYNAVQAHAALLPGECADVYRAMVEVEAAERAWWEAFDALPAPQQSQAERLLIAEALAPTPDWATSGHYSTDDSDHMDGFYSGVEK